MMLALEQNMPESSPIRSHMQMRRDVPPPDPPRPPEEAVLLRIFIGEDDRYKRLPLYEAIVLKARETHLAGATVLRGFLGFGKSSHMHTEKILRLSMDLPMVIEIVDTLEKVNAFLPYLEPMMRGGLVTLERARVIRFKHEAAPNRIGHWFFIRRARSAGPDLRGGGLYAGRLGELPWPRRPNFFAKK
jgi:uncharacterized protein